jgi:GT2 family glycosyltransferase
MTDQSNQHEESALLEDPSKQNRLHFVVIIPSLNSPIIDQTLDSLLVQECPDVEYSIVVVGRDDENLIKDHDRVRFVESDVPLSPAEARNLGVLVSKSEHIAFTDADCIADPQWLQTLAGILSRDPDLIVGGGVAFETKDGWTSIDNFSSFHDSLAHLPAEERTQLPSLNLAMRRADFESIGGFDESFPHAAGEDSDLTFRLRLAGCKLLFFPGAIVHHQPARNSFRQLIRHAYLRGQFSLLVDPRYIGEIGLPRFLRTPLRVLLLAPFMAAYATLRIYLTKAKMGAYLWMMPFVYLTKIAWCFGAMKRLSGLDPIVNPGSREAQ